MNIIETVTQKLTANGWIKETFDAKKPIDLRLSYRINGQNLEIDHRYERKELWLWLIGNKSRQCLGIKDDTDLDSTLQKIIAMQDSMRVEDYLSNYLDLQSVCDVSIIMWQQFEDNYDPNNHTCVFSETKEPVATDPKDPDPLVFPGKKIAKLSDYVKFMKIMQNGDINRAMKEFGLDYVQYGSLATDWMTRLNNDTVLNQKMIQMMIA